MKAEISHNSPPILLADSLRMPVTLSAAKRYDPSNRVSLSSGESQNILMLKYLHQPGSLRANFYYIPSTVNFCEVIPISLSRCPGCLSLWFVQNRVWLLARLAPNGNVHEPHSASNDWYCFEMVRWTGPKKDSHGEIAGLSRDSSFDLFPPPHFLSAGPWTIWEQVNFSNLSLDNIHYLHLGAPNLSTCIDVQIYVPMVRRRLFLLYFLYEHHRLTRQPHFLPKFALKSQRFIARYFQAMSTFPDGFCWGAMTTSSLFATTLTWACSPTVTSLLLTVPVASSVSQVNTLRRKLGFRWTSFGALVMFWDAVRELVGQDSGGFENPTYQVTKLPTVSQVALHIFTLFYLCASSFWLLSKPRLMQGI